MTQLAEANNMITHEDLRSVEVIDARSTPNRPLVSGELLRYPTFIWNDVRVLTTITEHGTRLKLFLGPTKGLIE